MRKSFLLVCLLAVAIVLAGCVQPDKCGNGLCDAGENPENCPADCPASSFEKFSFVVYGDSRGVGDVNNKADYTQHRKLAALIEARDPDFVLNTGDLVYEGCSNEQWDNFLDIVEGICRSKDAKVRCDSSTDYLDSGYYPVIGNHEKIASCSEHYFSAFPFLVKGGIGQRYYSFGYENAFFIVLDSSNDKEIANAEGKQFKWLEGQLQATQNYDFVFVFFHHAPFSSSWMNIDNEAMKRHWLPLFKEQAVDAVFNGHIHLFARTFVDGTHYVTTGGGGAPLHPAKAGFAGRVESIHHFVLVSVDNDRLLFEVFDQNNSLVVSW